MTSKDRIRAAGFAALATLALTLYAMSLGTAEVRTVRGPYLQHLDTDAITVLWETEVEASTVVRYGTGGHLGMTITDKPGMLHEVRLSGLKPDTEYSYSVSSDGVSTDVFKFRTAPVKTRPFRFVAFGDSRSDPETVALISSEVAALEPPAGFAIHTGDVVDEGDELEHWDEEFFGPAQTMMASLPVYFATGNHEQGSKYLSDFFDTTGNGRWYDFTYSNAAFVCLDTTENYAPGSEQYEWLTETLEKHSDAAWLFVFMHDPAYSTGLHGGSESVRKELVPLFEKYGVDVVFCGHDHDYERSVVNGVTYVVTGGYGAPLYDQHRESPYSVKFASRHHFCVVDVDGGTAKMTAFADDGGVIEEVEWKAGKDKT